MQRETRSRLWHWLQPSTATGEGEGKNWFYEKNGRRVLKLQQGGYWRAPRPRPNRRLRRRRAGAILQAALAQDKPLTLPTTDTAEVIQVLQRSLQNALARERAQAELLERTKMRLKTFEEREEGKNIPELFCLTVRWWKDSVRRFDEGENAADIMQGYLGRGLLEKCTAQQAASESKLQRARAKITTLRQERNELRVKLTPLTQDQATNTEPIQMAGCELFLGLAVFWCVMSHARDVVGFMFDP